MPSIPPVTPPAFHHYRLYKTDDHGHFIDVREFGATSDLAAIDLAVPPKTGPQELWEGGRRVLELPAEAEDAHDDRVYDEATTVTTNDGEVVLKGPDGVDVTMTPEAAEKTSERLVDQAGVAREKRRARSNPHKA